MSHLTVLRNMRKGAITLIEQISKEDMDSGISFRMGFHAVPSLKQLHMHVISEDFNSPCLNSKKHWNSFTTEFFISTDNFIKILDQKGKIEFDKTTYNAYLKAPLKHWESTQIFPTLPKLKLHLQTLQQK